MLSAPARSSKRPSPVTSRPAKVALAASALALLTPALTGCFNGFNASTNVQSTLPINNGVELVAGDISAENTTVVLDDSGNATLLMRVTNSGVENDSLIAAVINGIPATIVGSPVEVAPGNAVSFGWESDTYVNVSGLDAAISSYVPVALQFDNAGITEGQVMIVPPAGIYEGIVPSTQ